MTKKIWLLMQRLESWERYYPVEAYDDEELARRILVEKQGKAPYDVRYMLQEIDLVSMD